MAKYEVDPISRIEGHLGVKVEVSGGTIIDANAHGNLWRGFENFLIGRQANDAITFTQRICGVCPLPHATASTFAVESVLNVSDGYVTFLDDGSKGVPARALHIRNLVYGAEFLMSHITHFYHLAAQSYVQGPPIPPWTPHYADSQYAEQLRSSGHGTVDGATHNTNAGVRGILPFNDGNGSADLWSAVITQYVKALRIRRLTFEAGALFAGRMPMTADFVAGGVTNSFSDADFAARCEKFRTIMVEVGNFIVEEYVPLAFALGALYPAFDNSGGADGFGSGCGNFLAWGAFPQEDGSLDIAGGVVIDARTSSAVDYPLLANKSGLADAIQSVKDHLVEVIARSRYENSFGFDSADYAYPGDVTRTEPLRSDAEKYSWMKAPRWAEKDVSNSASAVFSGVAEEVTVTVDAADGRNVRLDGVPDSAYTVTYLGGSAWTFTRTVPAEGDPSVENGTYAVKYDIFHPCEVGPFARMIVNGKYPLGVNLIDPSAAPGSVPRAYADLYTSGGGLDLTVISADLAHALTQEGLVATVQSYLLGVKGGLSTIDRLRGRAIEAFWIVTWMLGAYDKTIDPVTGRAKGYSAEMGAGGWIDALYAHRASEAGADLRSYKVYAPPTTTVAGLGVSEAPRGALAHFVTATAGKVGAYQCVVPTTWNGSPKDGGDSLDGVSALAGDNVAVTKRGPLEQAMISCTFDASTAPLTRAGTTNTGVISGVEVLRVAQSFDPCIACAVH
ncbi:MAG: nickel-dependent hydrogenase large subunit [Coriobacteriia bacterium]|nr:nickel-dependent hydrogenase large subunit [Coriobacteriia bacterium]